MVSVCVADVTCSTQDLIHPCLDVSVVILCVQIDLKGDVLCSLAAEVNVSHFKRISKQCLLESPPNNFVSLIRNSWLSMRARETFLQSSNSSQKGEKNTFFLLRHFS